MNGKHMMKGKEVGAAVDAKSGAEVQHPTVAQDRKKGRTMAQTLYPVRRGLRGTIMQNGKDSDNNSY